MIWHTIINVLAALIRNAFQRGHHCTSLDYDTVYTDWTWECSCGAWGFDHGTELQAIQSFSAHTQHKPVKV